MWSQEVDELLEKIIESKRRKEEAQKKRNTTQAKLLLEEIGDLVKEREIAIAMVEQERRLAPLKVSEVWKEEGKQGQKRKIQNEDRTTTNPNTDVILQGQRGGRRKKRRRKKRRRK